MKQLNVTELDFDQIKRNLGDYFKQAGGGAYSDWDFEGSGLNQLLDVLAYNTHYNGVLAHNALNESFLDTAQIRSNVVSRAKLLGYVPQSRSTAKATVVLTYPSSVSENDSFTIEAGTKFKTVIDDDTYTFITLTDYTTQKTVNDQFIFTDVDIYQGRIKKNRYIVDENDLKQRFEVVDDTIDTRKLSVNVFSNSTSSFFEAFTPFDQIATVDANSSVYFIDENYNSNYEISFGDNIFGKKPKSLNIVEISYISTLGDVANNANVFAWANSAVEPDTIVTTSKSSGGASREGIESIRFNAPLTFVAQNRTVTVDDYKAIIGQSINGLQTLSVWGGQDNNPPEYGKTFICAKPEGSDVLTDAQKSEIYDVLRSKKILAIIPKIVDPTYTNIYFDVLFKYNSNQTTLSQGQLDTKVRDVIETYNTEELQKFDGIFRYSNFLSLIDNSDFSILSSFVRVYVYKTINATNAQSISVNFEMGLYGDVNGEESIISSDSWNYGGISYRLADEPIEGNDNERNIYAYRVASGGQLIKVYNSLGTVNVKDGLISLDPMPTDETQIINVYASPASNDIISKRSNLLKIDEGKTQITSDVDTLAVSGSSGAINYNTFNRQR